MTLAVDREPVILGFLCNWCSYAGADLAGVSRIQYPATVRTIRVMCSSRVDPIFIMEGFLKGADGVMVLGCHPGECHYSTGNYETINMVDAVRKLLDYVGVKRERLFLDWVSASEGIRFGQLVEGFTGQIRKLGALGVAEGKSAEQMKFALEAAKRVVSSEKFRLVLGRQTEFMQSGNKYGEKFTGQEFRRAIEATMIQALLESKILLLLTEKPLSVKEIAQKANLLPSQVLGCIAGLRKKRMATLFDISGTSPLYCLASNRT